MSALREVLLDRAAAVPAGFLDPTPRVPRVESNNRHNLEWADPTADLAHARREVRAVVAARLSRVEDYLRANPHSTVRAVSRGLGNMSRRHVQAALDELVRSGRMDRGQYV